MLIPQPVGALQVPARPLNQADASVSLPPIQLSLVLPTYQESQTLASVVRQLVALLDQALPQAYELIVVDDDSPDQTWALAAELTGQFPQLRVMRRQGERGLSSAVIRGWQVATGPVLGVMDADLQHPPQALLKLLAQVQAGADLAVASRHVEGGGVSEWSLARRVLSRGAQVLGLVLLPSVVGRVSDPMSGFFLVRRSAIAGPRLAPAGYKILLEVIGRGNVEHIAEVGYVFQERAAGESKVTWRQYGAYLQHLLKLRFDGHLSRWNRLKSIRQLPLARLLRFGVVGLSGVFVDMAVLYLLSDPSTLAWGLTRSKVIAAGIAMINNFVWNDAWTFADVSSRQQGWSARLKRLLKFVAICSGGLVLNVLVLNLLFNQVFGGQGRYLANLIAIAVATLWNFWINVKLNWRVTQVPRDKVDSGD